jgi:hypothetical protein
MEAGREMDKLIVENIMGGFCADPDAWTDDETILYCVYHGDVLVGKPYASEFHEGKYSHSWERFEPSINIASAWSVVEKMNFFQVVTMVKTYEGRLYSARVDGVRISAPTAPLAICRAALLATMGKS